MSPEVSGRTAVYGIAGDPIAHSLSPALHQAAFDALGVDAVSVAFRADEAAADAVVALVAELGVRGLSVTMPLKTAVAARCANRTELVERLGACNTLVWTPSGALADSTDGDGLVSAIECVAKHRVESKRCAVLGAGGAARAAIEALSRAGAADVLVVARRPDAAAAAAAVGSSARPASAADALGAEIVVQATPVGMDGGPAGPGLLDGGRLGSGQIAIDLVYHPRVTRWLAAATAAGATPVPGAEVLVHQARLALERWLDTDVPLGPLHEVVA